MADDLGVQTPKTLYEQAARDLDEIDGELRALHEKGFLPTDPEQERFDELLARRDETAPIVEKYEERAKRIEDIQKSTYRKYRGMPERMSPIEEVLSQDIRSISWNQARDNALRMLDDRETSFVLSTHQREHVEKQVRAAHYAAPGGVDIARRILVTENDGYRSAFMKLMRDPNAPAYLTDQERVAMLRYSEYRAQSEGTSAAGGYAIPVFIDPSIILTDQETDNPFLTLARQEDVNTNAWKGVSSAGVSWSFDSEASAVSDDSLTSIAQPSVTIFMARGFIPYSQEIAEDWPGFQAEMARVLNLGYDELLVDKFSRGSGTGEPRGILTALAASSPTSIVTSTTDGAFGQEDIFATWSALPQKYRRRAAWMMNVDVMNHVRQMGTLTNWFATTVTLPDGAITRLFDKPVYESPYFPVFSSTTGAANRLVVGDWSNYLIARRSGMSVELVPQLFDITNNRPTGSRGWFAYARIGGNSINDAAFRLQANT